MRALHTVSCAMAVVGCVAAAQPARAGFYDSKNVTVIVNGGAGGGLTRIAQTFSAFMEKHLGNGTNMIVKNLPGGGGLKALNVYARDIKPDGLTVLWGNKNLMAVVLKSPGVHFDPSKFTMIGWYPDTFVTIARADTGKGIKNPKDLMSAGGIVVGGRAPSSPLDLYSNLPLHILGIKYRYVSGYTAQNKMLAAIRSKEINTITTGDPGYEAFYKPTLLKSGEATALFYHSPFDYETGEPLPVGDRFPTSLHSFSDYYRSVKGKDPSGPLWQAYKWYSTFGSGTMGYLALKATPADRIAALRKAYGETVKDPAFLAALKKQIHSLPVHFYVGKEGEFLLTDYKNISPAALNGLRELTTKLK